MSDATATSNHAGHPKTDYTGEKSTLCIGCGHDQITRTIIAASYESGVDPYSVVKTSGIGCSSKTPAYFINKGYGINSVHGRMPSVATGANMANHNLMTIGVSGDGDTASIGMGQFCHVVRRNTNMVYVVENNGVYGLTKGQFSATSEKGSKKKGGEINDYSDIDLCTLALEMGCGFVARSYSGDTKQMVNLLRAAINHNGLAFIDCISPCVTFNNLPDSTKGFTWLREHNIQLHEVGFVADYDAKQVEQQPGDITEVDMPDGSHIVLHALNEQMHDPTDIGAARRILEKDRLDQGHVYTGLLYYDKDSEPLHEIVNLPNKPLAQMDESDCRMSEQQFADLMQSYC